MAATANQGADLGANPEAGGGPVRAEPGRRAGGPIIGPARRLLHLLDYAPRGTRTIDHMLLAHARRLRADGWAVRFAFPAAPPPAFAAELATAGAGYLTARFPFTWAAARALVRELAGYRPDVTQVSFVGPFTWPLLALRAAGYTRRLIVIDQASGDVTPHRGMRRTAAWVRGRAAGRFIDAFAAVSTQNARRAVARAYLPAGKVAVIPNGIPVERFPAPPRPPRPGLRVAFAGQLIPAKGVMTLLRAVGRLRAAGEQIALDVAGAGGQEAELKAFAAAERLDGVLFLGHTDAVPDLFAAADVVVVPSVWAEGFGLVAAEAMASGAAVVVSDAGALPEVVGPAGVVFRAGDDADLADKLLALARDPGRRADLGRAGRDRAVRLYSLEANAERHAELCRAVMP